jgi:uncharacterized membrane protein YkgB
MTVTPENQGRLRFYSFMVGLGCLFVGILLLARWHSDAGWARGVGVWCTLIGAVDVLITQPWK